MNTKVAKKLKIKAKPLPNNKTLVTFKMDKDLKKEIDKVLDEMGLTLSAMLNALVKKVAREKKIEISLDRVTVNSLEELEEKIMEGSNSPMIDLEDSYLFKRLEEAKSRRK